VEEIIFEGFGIRILRVDGKLLVEFDAGGIVGKSKRASISEEESIRAQRSEKDAYEIIINRT
jgi:hypothetical protein